MREAEEPRPPDQQPSHGARNDLIEEYRTYVRYVAGRIMQTMRLPSEIFDELVSAGYLGLVEAAERFRPDAGAEFKNYAFFRIRGAIVDSIRRDCELSGRAYRLARAFLAANEIREEDALAPRPSGRPDGARPMEVALQCALAYRLTASEVEEEISDCGPDAFTPERDFFERERSEKIRLVVRDLPEKERFVIEEYYFRERSFHEVAEANEGMSKSWVSRLHTRALERLRKTYMGEEPDHDRE